MAESRVFTKVEKKRKTQSSKLKSTAQELKPAKKGKLLAKAEVEVKTEARSSREKQKKLTVAVYDASGKESGYVDLPGEIFGLKENKSLVSQAVRVYLASQRASGAHTKTRGEVRGSTRKIYRQKGTGRARHGARYAPIFVGGGVAHGPRTHGFSLSLPQKMRRKALFTVLSNKLREEKLKILDSVEKVDGKTKKAAVLFRNLGVATKRGKADKVLFVLPGKLESFEKAARNIEGLMLEKASNLHTYAVIDSKSVILMKDSISILENTFLGQKKIAKSE